MPKPVAELTPEQHEARRGRIGGSDAAAACGMSPWKSRVELWLEKTGRSTEDPFADLPKGDARAEAMHFGNVMEAVVAEEFERRFESQGYKLRRRSEAYVHSNGFMIAHLDRLIEGTDLFVECKNASAFSRWQGVPDHYRLQVEHEALCSGRVGGFLAAIVGGNSWFCRFLERSERLSEELVRREAEFMQFVTTDQVPPLTGPEDVLALYPTDNGKALEATPELLELHAELMQVRQTAKEAEEEKKRVTRLMQEALGPNVEILLPPRDVESRKKADRMPRPIVTWKTDNGTLVVRWQDAFHDLATMNGLSPDDQEKFLHNYTTRRYSRRFLPKEIKENG